MLPTCFNVFSLTKFAKLNQKITFVFSSDDLRRRRMSQYYIAYLQTLVRYKRRFGKYPLLSGGFTLKKKLLYLRNRPNRIKRLYTCREMKVWSAYVNTYLFSIIIQNRVSECIMYLNVCTCCYWNIARRSLRCRIYSANWSLAQ